VGPNGSGKTTLMRILVGEDTSDTGEVRGRRGVTVGYLPQEAEIEESGPLISFVENVDGELKEVREEISRIEGVMAQGVSDDATLERYGHLQGRFEHLGGYGLRSEAMRILHGLGFADEEVGRPVDTFSGGWRMRALMARILLKQPDVILMDEPTNHLDILSLEWIEDFIKASPAAFLIVSHDVNFIDRIVTDVIALEPQAPVRVKGNYSKYYEMRAERIEREHAAWEREMRKRAEEQRYIDRFRSKSTKARQVQSRIKQLEKNPMPAAPQEPVVNRPKIQFPQPERTGKDVIKIEGVDAGYGELKVFEKLDFRAYRGEKVALIGPNGAGKSTLLKLIAGVLAPQKGEISFGHNVTSSYFSQHQMELLSPQRTVLEEILTLPGLRTEQYARTLLGSFLFSGDDVEKKVSVLSGGEKSRLSLARIMTSPGNLLLMDEPTNHLDIDSCAVLRDALERFEGTLILITHDRDLINHVADRVIYVDKGSYEDHRGNYDDFLMMRRLGAKKAEEQKNTSQPSGATEVDGDSGQSYGKEARRQQAQQRDKIRRATKPLAKEIASLEEEEQRHRTRLAEVEESLTKPEVYGNPFKVGELSRERSELTKRVDEIGDRWAEASLEMEELEESLGSGA
jgi:ATP-binding cassette subfamily F protein 3